MATFVFPGSFQPFHTGHFMVIEGMVNAGGTAVVVICEPDSDALFSTDDVREMISAALLEENMMDVTIASVADCDDDAEWVDKVLEVAGGDDIVVWSGKDEVRELFEAQGVPTKKISEVPGHVTEEIKEMIESGSGGWRSKVPAGAMDVIEKKVNGKRE